jgi:HlyD family secretion protein
VKHSRHRIFLVAVAIAIVAALALAFRPEPIPVDSAAATRGPLMVTVDEDGRTRIKEIHVVSTPLAGRLLRIELDPGDPVEAGKTLVAALDPGDPTLLDPRASAQAKAKVSAAQAALSQSEANLERARAADDRAQRELERKTVVWDKGFLSESEYDNVVFAARSAEKDLRAAESALQIARFELEQAEAALLHTRGSSGADGEFRFEIRSPIDGRVLRIFQESSTVVAAGAPLLEVGDPRDLEVIIDVLSRDAVQIAPGAKVILEHWGGEAPLLGCVRIVEPAAFTKISALGVEEQRVNVLVDFSELPESRPTLGDAYRVEARIVVWEAGDVLKIPAGALFRHGENWAVFLVKDGKAVLREVEAGHANGLETEVLGGLEAGDEVILHPSDQIVDGRRVAPR